LSKNLHWRIGKTLILLVKKYRNKFFIRIRKENTENVYHSYCSIVLLNHSVHIRKFKNNCQNYVNWKLRTQTRDLRHSRNCRFYKVASRYGGRFRGNVVRGMVVGQSVCRFLKIKKQLFFLFAYTLLSLYYQKLRSAVYRCRNFSVSTEFRSMVWVGGTPVSSHKWLDTDFPPRPKLSTEIWSIHWSCIHTHYRMPNCNPARSKVCQAERWFY
jgi:hypothetical protein